VRAEVRDGDEPEQLDREEMRREDLCLTEGKNDMGKKYIGQRGNVWFNYNQ